MALHPGEGNRYFPEDAPATSDLIRRALEEDKDWYRDLVEHSHDLLCVHDLEGRFLSVNPVPARLLGYSVEELRQKPMRDFVDPEFRDQFDVYLREIEHKGEARGLLAVVTRSGERRIWEYRNTLRTEGVERQIVRGMAHDVTEREQAAKALRASNEQMQKTAREQELLLRELTMFRTLLDQSNDCIVVVDPETLRILDANGRTSLELGYSRQELLSMTIPEIDRNVDQDFRARMDRELRDTGFVIVESVNRRKDGTTFPVELNMRLVQHGRNYVVAVSRDITTRKRSEERLREFERVVENLEEMIVVVSRDRRYVIANRAFLRLRGMTQEQLEGRFVAELMPDVYEMTVKAKLDECFGGKVVNYEIRIEYPGMGERDLAVTYLPVEGPAEIDRVACVLRDITEQKRAEETLRQSEERLRLAQEAARIGVFERNFKTGETRWSPEMEAMFGLSPGKFPKSSEGFLELIHAEDRPTVARLLERSVQAGDTEGEWRVIWPDGTEHWIAGRWRVFKDEHGTPVRSIGMDFDITERKRAEEKLRQSEERFRVALKNSPITVFTLNQDLRCTWVYNLQVPGLTSGPLGKTAGEFFGPEDGERIREIGRQVLETGVGTRHEVQVTDSDGVKHYFDATIEPLVDATGAVIGVTGAGADVTEFRKATEALREAQKKLTEEKLYLEQEIDSELGFGEIIGKSKALRDMMANVNKVATCDAAVLLLGDTGTGKELVARAIHRMSQRANNSFIKMNCAAIPSGLLESELFGNEKGAFTGAVTKKIGRLELADKGTLFLDEIGEIPLALQPKLLRVLQDQEFERLGGTQTLKVDFRLIAATNRDLADMVQKREFRNDLYYRLNVFPVRVPLLRERREDLPLLVEHFVQRFARRMNKSITSIPKKTMDALTEWEWPGNIRELENFVERSVILTQGSVLVAPLGELTPYATAEKGADENLQAVERKHILRALRESRGQIGGLKGAAMRLGLKRTTLQSKLKHLGIDPHPGRMEH